MSSAKILLHNSPALRSRILSCKLFNICKLRRMRRLRKVKKLVHLPPPHTHTTCQYKIPHARAPGVQGAALAPLQKKTQVLRSAPSFHFRRLCLRECFLCMWLPCAFSPRGCDASYFDFCQNASCAADGIPKCHKSAT